MLLVAQDQLANDLADTPCTYRFPETFKVRAADPDAIRTLAITVEVE